jgi:diacylglycerol kinase family enzyme
LNNPHPIHHDQSKSQPNYYFPDRSIRIGVVSNPDSGTNLKGMTTFRKLLAPRPDVLHRVAKTLADTTDALSVFAQNRVNVVVINGGDGTIQTVLTTLLHFKPFRSLPVLALLRGGTDSIIARDAGISGSRDVGMRKLLKWADSRNFTQQLIRRHIMKTDLSFRKHPIYGMIFGAAVIYDGIRFCRKNIHSRGLTGELAPGFTLARFMFDLISNQKKYLRPAKMDIKLDQHPALRGDFFLVLATTVEQLFLKLRPFYGSESGALHFTAIGDHPKHLLKALPYLAKGQKNAYLTSKNGYHSHNVHEIQVAVNSGFTLDGELFYPVSNGDRIAMSDAGQATFLKF